MTKRITAKTAKEWKSLVGKVPVRQIAEQYGVTPGTVHFHTNKHNAERRREQWRRCVERKRLEDPTFRERNREACRRYNDRLRAEASHVTSQ